MRGLLLLVALALSPAHARDWADHRARRAALLEHRMPLAEAVDGRARPDQTGSVDLERLRIELDLGEGGILPPSGRFVLELEVGPREIAAVGLVAFFYFPDEIRRDGRPLDFERVEETGELLIALDGPAAPGARLTLEMDVRFGEYCLEPANCIEGAALRHLVEYGWYPLNLEFPVEDRMLIETVLRAPPGLVPAAVGVREGVEEDGGRVTWRYRTETPTVLPMLAAGPFEIEPVDPIVEVFVPPGTVDRGQLVGQSARAAVTLFAELFAPFPFDRLGVTPISDDAGVGLGPQANILLPESFWQIGPDRPEADLVHEVTAHEVGHQYFFNLLGVVDPAEGWMSEGFAEYAATRASEARTGRPDHARLNYWSYLLFVDALADAPLASEAINVAPPSVRVAVLYEKGSVVLHQLRRRVPDFDGALSGFVRRYAGEIVTTAELQRFLEAEAGVDLARFFGQWIHRAGFPRLSVRITPPRDGSDRLELVVRQLPGRHGEFAAEVPLRGHFEDGAVREVVVRIGPDPQTVDLGRAQWLQLDPELSIFRRLQADPAADVNLSGVVDGMDLLDLFAAEGRAVPDPDWRDALDVNRDQVIDDRDRRQALEQFGAGW